MKNIKESNLDDEDKKFLDEIRLAVGPDSLTEVLLRYKEFIFSIEPEMGKIAVYGFQEPLYFDSIEHVFEKLLLDGKSFLMQLDFIEYA